MSKNMSNNQQNLPDIKNNFSEFLNVFCWKRNYKTLSELYKNLNIQLIPLEDYKNDKIQIEK